MTITDYINREVPAEIAYLETEATRDQAAEDALLPDEEKEEIDEQTRLEVEQANEEAFDLTVSAEPLHSSFSDELDFVWEQWIGRETEGLF